MSDTPKTDLQAHAFGGKHTAMFKGNLIASQCLPVAFSQELERELNAVTTELANLRASQMTEEKAREVLGVLLKGEEIDYESQNKEANWPFYCNGILIKSAAHLVGIFDPDQLEAISWWMRNKGVQG